MQKKKEKKQIKKLEIPKIISIKQVICQLDINNLPQPMLNSGDKDE